MSLKTSRTAVPLVKTGTGDHGSGPWGPRTLCLWLSRLWAIGIHRCTADSRLTEAQPCCWADRSSTYGQPADEDNRNPYRHGAGGRHRASAPGKPARLGGRACGRQSRSGSTHRPGRPGIAETSLRQESSSPIAAVETKSTLQECVEAIVGGILLQHGVDGCIHSAKSLELGCRLRTARNLKYCFGMSGHHSRESKRCVQTLF